MGDKSDKVGSLVSLHLPAPLHVKTYCMQNLK